MEIGIDSFIATGAYNDGLRPEENMMAMEALLSKIAFADRSCKFILEVFFN